MWIREYDGTGLELWTQTHSGAAAAVDVATAVSSTPPGEVVVAGHSTAGGQTTAIVQRYSTSGTLQWTATYLGVGSDAARPWGVAADLASHAIAVGGEDNSGQGSGIDVFARKLDPAGTLTGHGNFDGPAGRDDVARAVATDLDNAFFVVGETIVAEGQPADILVRKQAADGSLLWEQIWGAPVQKADVATGVAVDPDGNAVVVGTTTTAGDRITVWIGKFAA
jgi:hypothetical protein